MFIFLFLVFTSIAIYHAIQFHKTLSLASKEWNTKQDIKIFGSNFKTSAQMYSDIHFLNCLWVGKGITDIPLNSLKSFLVTAKKHLRFQFLFGLLGFISVVINGVMAV